MDVATVRNENANLRKIQQKLLQWETLAPLTTNQLDFLEQLNEICDGNSKKEVGLSSSLSTIQKHQRFHVNFYLKNKNPLTGRFSIGERYLTCEQFSRIV